MVQAFHREAILWMNLSHEHVLLFVGVAEDVFQHPAICMVLPWMPNGNIRQHQDRLQAQGKLAGESFREYVDQWVSASSARTSIFTLTTMYVSCTKFLRE